MHEKNKTKTKIKDYNAIYNSQKISVVCSVFGKRSN